MERKVGNKGFTGEKEKEKRKWFTVSVCYIHLYIIITSQTSFLKKPAALTSPFFWDVETFVGGAKSGVGPPHHHQIFIVPPLILASLSGDGGFLVVVWCISSSRQRPTAVADCSMTFLELV